MSERLIEIQSIEEEGSSVSNLSLPHSVPAIGFMGNVVSTPWHEIDLSAISKMVKFVSSTYSKQSQLDEQLQ